MTDGPQLLRTSDEHRVRTFVLDRPEALNAFNEALYDALDEALQAAADDPARRRRPSSPAPGELSAAGTDLLEMAARSTDPDFVPGRYGFPGDDRHPHRISEAAHPARSTASEPRHRGDDPRLRRPRLHVDRCPAQVSLHQPRGRPRGSIELHVPSPCSVGSTPTWTLLGSSRMDERRGSARTWGWCSTCASPTICIPRPPCATRRCWPRKPISTLVETKRLIIAPAASTSSRRAPVRTWPSSKLMARSRQPGSSGARLRRAAQARLHQPPAGLVTAWSCARPISLIAATGSRGPACPGSRSAPPCRR